MFANELEFEDAVVKCLENNGWTNGVIKNPTEKDLINNWANILFENNRTKDRLDDYRLTETEMQQIINKINEQKTPLNLNKFINGKEITIKRDNIEDKLHYGKEVTLKIFDKYEIAAGSSRYQIAEQPKFAKKNALLNDRRGDLMLLINGMPVFHIELKNKGVPVTQATYQIEKYSHEGVYTGIFSLVQIFVAMTPEETVYFANPGSEGNFNKAFYFHWQDFSNQPINEWSKVISNLLSIPIAHQLIGQYTIADDNDKTLKVMRSYQYYAASRIADIVTKIDWEKPNTKGGYVWHTTGSGKTMTSFKAAQLIAEMKKADKVVFLMDRIELGTQSLSEFRGFADIADDVAGTENTKVLISKLADDSPSNSLIVTSIQKMSKIGEKETILDETIKKINRKKIVIIIDECHRDTFGKMLADIMCMFPNAVLFGFTGTPIIDDNAKNNGLQTTDIFGSEIHRYTIADGIRDGNVLEFDLHKVSTFDDKNLREIVALKECKVNSESEALSNSKKASRYYEFMEQKNMAGYTDEKTKEYVKGIEDYIPSVQYDTDTHRELVVKNILSNWNRISRNKTFSGILATNSILEAIEYYRLFKKKNDIGLKFTVLVDSNLDNNENTIFKEDGLIEILEDYNKMYNQKLDLSKMNLFKKDVSSRLSHKTPYNNISEEDKIDLLIVVDQMLTGFDSKFLNALYIDKVLKYENIIQAFSRTNRVYKMELKPFGIIKYYRKIHTMKRNITNAIRAYSGNREFGVFVPKLEENLELLNLKYKEIEVFFKNEGIKNFEKVPENEEAQRKFVKLYNEFSRILNAAKIQGFNPKSSIKDDNTKNEIAEESEEYTTNSSEITTEQINALKMRYRDISNIHRKSPPGSIPFEIEGNLIEIDDGKIDENYMNERFKQYRKSLEQKNLTPEELNKALEEMHSSFANLSKEQQKYAELLLHDIKSGDIELEPNKTFMEYIQEYQSRIENDSIKVVANIFCVNEDKLRKMKRKSLSESEINDNGFDALCETMNKELVRENLKQYVSEDKIKGYKVNRVARQLLRDFITKDISDIEELFKNIK